MIEYTAIVAVRMLKLRRDLFIVAVGPRDGAQVNLFVIRHGETAGA